MRKQAGITLVELLIAAAILLLLLAAASALYLVSTRAYETNREVTASAAQLRTAIQAIQSDFGQAGFTGRDVESLAGATPLTFELGDPYCLNGEESPCARQLDWLTLRYATDPESSTVRTVQLPERERASGKPIPVPCLSRQRRCCKDDRLHVRASRSLRHWLR